MSNVECPQCRGRGVSSGPSGEVYCTACNGSGRTTKENADRLVAYREDYFRRMDALADAQNQIKPAAKIETWKQFKDFVESKGVADETRLEWIDVSFPYVNGEMNVALAKDGSSASID